MKSIQLGISAFIMAFSLITANAAVACDKEACAAGEHECTACKECAAKGECKKEGCKEKGCKHSHAKDGKHDHKHDDAKKDAKH